MESNERLAQGNGKQWSTPARATEGERLMLAEWQEAAAEVLLAPGMGVFALAFWERDAAGPPWNSSNVQPG